VRSAVTYDVVGDLLHQNIAVQAALALLAVKALIWIVSLASGTSPGVLAPLLMLGAGLGVVLSHALPRGEPALWPLVCMAAVLGATLGVPADRDHVRVRRHARQQCAVAGAHCNTDRVRLRDSRYGRSIMTENIARRGQHIYREYSVDPLEGHYVEDVMTTEAEAIDAQLSVRELLARYFGSAQRFRAYPVVANDP
jgi:hypothetical protein